MSTFEEKIAALVAPGPDRAAAGVTLVCGSKAGKVYQKTFGTTGVAPDAPALKPDDLAPMASCAKLITSIAALQCVERGQLTLDGDAAEVWPLLGGVKVVRGSGDDGKPQVEDLKEKITLRRLLTHTSGFAYAFISHNVLRYQRDVLGIDPMTYLGDLDAMGAGPLVFQPGEEGKWCYGVGIDIAGKLVEIVNGGIRLGEYCQRHIWSPLGLKDFVYRFADRQDLVPRVTPLTERVGGDLVDKGVEIKDPKDDWGGGGIVGCATEYFEILMAVFKEDTRILKKETWRSIREPQVVSPKDPNPMTIDMIIAEFSLSSPEPADDFVWTYGLACSIFQSDVPGWLRKGTLHWGGMRNCTWFIDHESELVTFFFVHLLPFEDPQVVELKAMFHVEMMKRFGRKDVGKL